MSIHEDMDIDTDRDFTQTQQVMSEQRHANTAEGRAGARGWLHGSPPF